MTQQVSSQLGSRHGCESGVLRAVSPHRGAQSRKADSSAAGSQTSSVTLASQPAATGRMDRPWTVAALTS